jgi:glycosyltransferase 2 family protein
LTDQTPAAQKKKKYLATAIRIVVSVGLLTFLFYKIGPTKIFDAIRAADPAMVLVIFGLMFAEHLHGTYKWLILLRGTTSHVPFLPMLRVRYLSAFIGTFGLGAVTIELVRMYGLARYTSDLAMSFTSILMDRLLGLTGLSIMIMVGVVMQSREAVAGIEYWAGGAIALILAGWLAIMNPRFRSLTDWVLRLILGAVGKANSSYEARQNAQSKQSNKLVRRVKRAVLRLLIAVLEMVRDKQRKIYQSLDTYRGRPGLLAWGMVQSLIFNVLRILVIWAGAMAVGVEVPISAYFVVVPAVIFAMLLPISMSGWGVREAMFVSLLTLYGADGETVLAMSLLVGVCAVLSTTPGAVLLMTGMGAPKPNGGTPVPEEQP